LSVLDTPVATSASVILRRICRSLPRAPPRGCAAAAAEQVVEAAETAEVAHEDVERVLEPEAAEAGRTAVRAALHTCVAVAVVRGALVGIPQDLVGLGRLLELLLGFLVAAVAVRMVLQRELAIGLLDGFAVRAPLHRQNLVIITHMVAVRSSAEQF
jgi:hypothetical protein